MRDGAETRLDLVLARGGVVVGRVTELGTKAPVADAEVLLFARQSGGQVRIHSQPGMGTTVSLYLVAGEAIEEAAAPESAVPQGNGQSVLLVEDDPSVRLLVRAVLEELAQRGGGRCLISICTAGGMGVVAILER